MWCAKCGAEMTEGAFFCPKCGTRQNTQQGENTSSKKPGPSTGGPTGIIVIVATGLAVTATIVATAIYLLGGSRSSERETVMAGIGTDSTSPEGNLPQDRQPEEAVPETPLYSIPDVAWVDITVQNYAAGTKQPGMTWDSSLFYWLEDVDTTSLDDGYIASCRVTKTLLRDAQSQKLRQYEIYSDPVSGDIYKIVSIEEVDGGLSLVDYYYRNGQPNFVFQRTDTVYTPTYATIEKVGERFYFNNEIMVRWRMIREPGKIGEYVLAPKDVWYSQGDYYAESDELRSIYDDVELRMLNESHNTYDAITAGGNIGMVQGYLQDTVGNGIAGKTVRVYRVSDNALLYETVSDDSGRYVFFVYLDNAECYVKVAADDLYKEMTVQGVCFAPSSVTYTYGLTMHKNSGDEYPVAFHLYSCMDVVSDENGTTTGGALQAATATVREGTGNYSGESIRTLETQKGELVTNLPSGVYTVQFHTEGYLDGYLEVEVMEEAAAVDAYVMPGLAETQTGVVLTWDSDEVDLDLTLFTPYQAGNGDMAHIGGNVDWDGNGNILIADNKSKCEVMFINSGVQGSFKLYVNNYTDSVAGNYASDALYRLNVHVYIYNSNGFVAEYTLPLGQTGVVWEVVEINGRNVTPAQRVYSEISGKSWWTESKEKEAVIRTKVTRSEYYGSVYTEYWEYDEHGNIVTRTSSSNDVVARGADGTATYSESETYNTESYEYIYDEYGNLKTKTTYWNGVPYERWEYEYVYVDGRISEKQEYGLWWDKDYGNWEAGSMGTTTVYDEKGRVISTHHDLISDYWFYNETEENITQFVNNNLLVESYGEYGDLYICDGNGNVLRSEQYESSTKTRYISEQYTYDANGNCISVRWGAEGGMLSWGEDWYYDEYNRLIQHDVSASSYSYADTYTYNSLGQLESKHTEIGDLTQHDSDTYYYYNEKGNLIKEETISYYDEESVESVGYEFVRQCAWYNGSRWIHDISCTEYTYY